MIGTLPSVAVPPGIRIHRRQRVSISEMVSKDFAMEIESQSDGSSVSSMTVTSRTGSLLSQRSVPFSNMEDPSIAQVLEGATDRIRQDLVTSDDEDIPACLSPVESLRSFQEDEKTCLGEEWRKHLLLGLEEKFVSESPVSTNCTGYCCESPSDAYKPHVVGLSEYLVMSTAHTCNTDISVSV